MSTLPVSPNFIYIIFVFILIPTLTLNGCIDNNVEKLESNYSGLDIDSIPLNYDFVYVGDTELLIKLIPSIPESYFIDNFKVLKYTQNELAITHGLISLTHQYRYQNESEPGQLRFYNFGNSGNNSHEPILSQTFLWDRSVVKDIGHFGDYEDNTLYVINNYFPGSFTISCFKLTTNGERYNIVSSSSHISSMMWFIHDSYLLGDIAVYIDYERVKHYIDNVDSEDIGNWGIGILTCNELGCFFKFRVKISNLLTTLEISCINTTDSMSTYNDLKELITYKLKYTGEGNWISIFEEVDNFKYVERSNADGTVYLANGVEYWEEVLD